MPDIGENSLGYPNLPFESYEPILIGEWGAKISKHGDHMMVFMWNIHDLTTQLRFFTSEYDAILWMEYMSARYPNPIDDFDDDSL